MADFRQRVTESDSRLEPNVAAALDEGDTGRKLLQAPRGEHSQTRKQNRRVCSKQKR